jgi:hypothetical protein
MGGAGARTSYFIASVVQWKEKSPWCGRPKFDRFCLFLEVEWEAAKLRWAGGRAAPRLAWQWAGKDGCAQRTGAHARPKPTSFVDSPLNLYVRHSFYLAYCKGRNGNYSKSTKRCILCLRLGPYRFFFIRIFLYLPISPGKLRTFCFSAVYILFLKLS